FGIPLVPAGPRGPIEIVSIVALRQLIRLVVEKAFANAELFRTVLVLQATPEHAIHELLKFVQFVLVRRTKLFHDRRDPRASASFVAKSSNPGAAVLHDD